MLRTIALAPPTAVRGANRAEQCVSLRRFDFGPKRRTKHGLRSQLTCRDYCGPEMAKDRYKTDPGSRLKNDPPRRDTVAERGRFELPRPFPILMGKSVPSLADYSLREENIGVGENISSRNSIRFRLLSSTPIRLASATRRLHRQSGLHCCGRMTPLHARISYPRAWLKPRTLRLLLRESIRMGTCS
jgi:hypothetical protein